MERVTIIVAMSLCVAGRAWSTGACGAPSDGAQYYVDTNAAPGGDGRSFETAFRFLQDAFTAAGDPTSAVILVAQGEYRPDRDRDHPEGTGDRDATFEFSGVAGLFGGFAGVTTADPYEQDPEIFVTTLSGDLAGDDGLPDGSRGDNAKHVVTIPVEQTAILCGLTISGGTTTGDCCGDDYYGGGVLHKGNYLRLTRCVVRDNEAASGAGVYVDRDARFVALESVFEGNRASSNGGGVRLGGETDRVASCTFTGNEAARGGAIYGATGIIEDSWFLANVATSSGGAIYAADGRIIDSVFSGNRAPTAGAVEGDAELIDRCTFSLNVAEQRGGAVRTARGTRIQSSILWGNTAGGEGDQIYGPGVTVNYSCVQGLTPEHGGFGNDDRDPRFVDALGADRIAGTADDDLRLLPGSPCINRGDPGPVAFGDLDIDGDDRVRVCRVDRGAFESHEQQDDCNSNGEADACDVLQGAVDDCNGNGIPDSCDIAGGGAVDCNGNGMPDECEAFVGLNRSFGPDSLINNQYIRYQLLSVPEVVTDVELSFRASSGLEGTNRGIRIEFDEYDLEEAFRTGAGNCVEPFDEDTVIVPMALFNERTAGGRTVEIELRPDVAHGSCEASWVEMTVRGVVRLGPNDFDRNGVPDDCECPADQNDDGQVGMADVLIIIATWGPAGESGIGDVDADGVVGMSDMLIVLAAWGACDESSG